MDPQAGNLEESAEKVINIVVIKDPSGWNAGSTMDFPELHVQHKNSGQQSSQFVQGRNATTHPPLYKSQSFTVGIPPSSLSISGQSFIDSSAFASSNSNDASASVSQVSMSSSTQTIIAKNLSVGGKYAQPIVHDNDMLASLEVDNCFAATPQAYSYSSDHVMRKKLIRHRSVPLSLQTNVPCPDKIISIHSNSNQTCSPSIVSPAHLSVKHGHETFNSPVATTPDSGFCTPSLLSAPFKALLSSTPTASSECPEVYLNGVADYSPVTDEKSLDSLFNNSIEWKADDSVDSAVDEEGHSPLNSSLRSVNWLKSFSIGESGLNISPPMSGTSQLDQGFSLRQIQQEGTQIQKSSSNKPEVRENTACTLPCRMNVQKKCTKASPSLFIPSLSAPIPINTLVMPTQIHSQMSDKPFLASSQCVGNFETPVRPSAPGELKMNKSRKSVTRTKNKGHLFPRPSYSYTDLIKLAIKSSDDGQLTLREIIAWIEDHFPFFKHEAKPNWKNTVTQSLSQHADFIKVDKKPGRKWTLCSTASHQHLKPVSKPPEIPSHLLASLNKSKRNVPQPILPKISAYALVPIQNLALEAVPQSNGNSNVQAKANVLPVPQHQHQQMIRILPNPQQQFTTRPDNANSSSKFALEKAKDKRCQGKEPKLSAPKSKFGNKRRKQSLQPSTSPYPALGQYLTPHGKKDEFRLVGKQTNLKQQRCNTLQCNKEITGLQKNVPGLSNLSKHHAFPTVSVLDIQEEEGTHLGEKKIILVLKDNQKCQADSININSQQSSITSMSESGVGCQPAFKRKLTKSITDKVIADSEKKMCLLKKSGPVMNLRHILQQDCQEDRVAAETIGQLLLEEDNKAVRANTEFEKRSSCGKFTRLKSDPWIKQYRSHQKTPIESGLNNETHCPQRNADNLDCSDQNYPIVRQTNSHTEKMLLATSKKSNIFRRVNIIKNKTSTPKLPIGADKLSSDANVNSNTNRVFASASQLIFPNPMLDEESTDSLSIFSGPHNLSELHSVRCVSDSSDLPRPTLYRTKSRRKQVHVPLTNEISPIRSYDNYHDNSRPNPKFQKILCSNEAGFVKVSSSAFLTSDILSPSSKKSISDDHNNSNNGSSSSCSDVENPSLHFFSTFSKTHDISNKENITHSGQSNNCTCTSLHQTRRSHLASKGTGDSKLRLTQSDGQRCMNCTPHSFHVTHTSLIPSDIIPAVMSTPPCGTRLLTHSITNTSTSFSNEPLTASSLSPSLSPGVMQQLNSIFPITPPSIMTPLSMSTPNRPSSYLSSVSQDAGDNSEVSPLPGSATGILDSSFLDHLETLLADLHPQQSSPTNGVSTRGFAHS